MALHHAGDSGTSIRLGDTICLALIGQRGFLTADGVSDNNLVFEKLHHGVNMPPNPRDVRFVVRRMANRRAQNELNRLHAKADYGYGGAVNGSGYDGRAELQRLAELEEQQNADDNRRLHRTPVGTGKVLCIVSDQGPNPGTLDIQLKDPSEASSDAHVRLFPALNSHDSHVDALTIRNGNLVVLEFVEQAMRLLITDGAAADKERPAGTLRTRGHPHVSRVDGVCATHTAGLRMEIMQLRAAEPETSLEKRLKLARRLNGSDVVKLAFTQTLEELALPAASWSTSSQLPTTTRPVFDRSIYKQQTFTNSMSWWVLEKTEMPSGAEEILAGVRHHYRIKHFVTGVYLGYVNRGQQRSAEDEGGIELTTWRSLREDKLGTTLFSLRLVAPAAFGDGADRSPGGDAATAPLCDGDTVNIVSVVSGYALNCHVAVCKADKGKDQRSSVAYSMQMLLAEQDIPRLVLTALQMCRNHLDTGPGARGLSAACAKFLLKITAGNMVVKRLLAEQEALLFDFLGKEVDIEALLVEIYRDNQAAAGSQGGAHRPLFQAGSDAAGCLPEILELYSALTVCDGVPMKHNQDLIAATVFAKQDGAGFSARARARRARPPPGEPAPRRPCRAKVKDAVGNWVDACSYMHITEHIVSSKSQEPEHRLLVYVRHTFVLLADLCGHRNRNARKLLLRQPALRELVDYAALTGVVQSAMVPSFVRSAASRLWHALYVDAEPHAPQPVLCTARSRSHFRVTVKRSDRFDEADVDALSTSVDEAPLGADPAGPADRATEAGKGRAFATAGKPGEGRSFGTNRNFGGTQKPAAHRRSLIAEETLHVPGRPQAAGRRRSTLSRVMLAAGGSRSAKAEEAASNHRLELILCLLKTMERLLSFGVVDAVAAVVPDAAVEASRGADAPEQGDVAVRGTLAAQSPRVSPGLRLGGEEKAPDSPTGRKPKFPTLGGGSSPDRGVDGKTRRGSRLGSLIAVKEAPSARPQTVQTILLVVMKVLNLNSCVASTPSRSKRVIVHDLNRVVKTLFHRQLNTQLNRFQAAFEARLVEDLRVRDEYAKKVDAIAKRRAESQAAAGRLDMTVAAAARRELHRVPIFNDDLDPKMLTNLSLCLLKLQTCPDGDIRSEAMRILVLSLVRLPAVRAAVDPDDELLEPDGAEFQRGSADSESSYAASPRPSLDSSGASPNGRRRTLKKGGDDRYCDLRPKPEAPPDPGRVTEEEIRAATPGGGESEVNEEETGDGDPGVSPEDLEEIEALRSAIHRESMKANLLSPEYRRRTMVQRESKVAAVRNTLRHIDDSRAVQARRRGSAGSAARCYDRNYMVLMERCMEFIELYCRGGPSFQEEVAPHARHVQEHLAVGPLEASVARALGSVFRSHPPILSSLAPSISETVVELTCVNGRRLPYVSLLRGMLYLDETAPELRKLQSSVLQVVIDNQPVLLDHLGEDWQDDMRAFVEKREYLFAVDSVVRYHAACIDLLGACANGATARTLHSLLSFEQCAATVIGAFSEEKQLEMLVEKHSEVYLECTSCSPEMFGSMISWIWPDAHLRLLRQTVSGNRNTGRGAAGKASGRDGASKAGRGGGVASFLDAASGGPPTKSLMEEFAEDVRRCLRFSGRARRGLGAARTWGASPAHTREPVPEAWHSGKLVVDYVCDCVVPAVEACYGNKYLMRELMRGKLRPMDDRCRKKLAMALFDFVTEVGPDLLDAKQLARVHGVLERYLDVEAVLTANVAKQARTATERAAEKQARSKALELRVATHADGGDEASLVGSCWRAFVLSFVELGPQPHEEAAQQIALLLLSAQGQFCIPYLHNTREIEMALHAFLLMLHYRANSGVGNVQEQTLPQTDVACATVSHAVDTWALDKVVLGLMGLPLLETPSISLMALLFSCQATRDGPGQRHRLRAQRRGARFALQLRSLLVRVGQWVAAHRDLRKKRIVYEKQVTHAKAIELRQTMATEQRKKTGILFGDGHKHAKGPDAATNLHVALAVAKARNQSRAPGLEHHKKARLTSEAHVGNSLKKARMTSEANLAGPGGGPRRSMVKHAGLGGSLGRSSVIKERASMVSFAGGGVTSRQRTGSIAGAGPNRRRSSLRVAAKIAGPANIFGEGRRRPSRRR
ncbi:hypothetical protein JL722_12429 [Aureococcus anophagefferens]|nr:hypothetical protein JL722_12429 [Aureococcus anophagefferens]